MATVIHKNIAYTGVITLTTIRDDIELLGYCPLYDESYSVTFGKDDYYQNAKLFKDAMELPETWCSIPKRWRYLITFEYRLFESSKFVVEKCEIEFSYCLSASEMEVDLKKKHNLYDIEVTEWELLEEGVTAEDTINYEALKRVFPVTDGFNWVNLTKPKEL